MGQARDFLKAATASSHRQLDENPLVASLAAGSLSESDYARMLSAYLSFYQPWEAQMQRDFPDLVMKVGEHRFSKSQWLRQDLSRLGPVSASVAFDLPAAPATAARAAGALYVVEGSTIGGMHLAKGGSLPAHASAFFTGYGPETMARWKELISDLEDLLPDAAKREEAADEAASTFTWFQRSFDRLVAAP